MNLQFQFKDKMIWLEKNWPAASLKQNKVKFFPDRRQDDEIN